MPKRKFTDEERLEGLILSLGKTELGKKMTLDELTDKAQELIDTLDRISKPSNDKKDKYRRS